MTAVVATLAALAAPSTSAHAQDREQVISHPAPISLPDGENFGTRLDLSGDAFIVGAPNGLFETLPSKRSGCAIYERVAGTWTLAYDKLQQYPASKNAGWDVAIDGEWAAYPELSVFPSGIGKVHVLHRLVGGWVESQLLTSPVALNPDTFGHSIDISGDLMVVGSPWQNRAFVYRLGGGTWVLEDTLQTPAGYEQADSSFGYGVAVSQTPAREAIIVGQPFYAVAGPNPEDQDGAAHIYVKDLTGWVLNTTVPPAAAPSPKSALGALVVLEGDVAAVAATHSFVFAAPFTMNGGALLLRWNGSAFALSTTIVGEDEEFAGAGLAIQGDRVYVGHVGWRGIDLDQASGRITGHRWTGSAWTNWPAPSGSFHLVEAVPDAYEYGVALAASGGRLVVGVPGTSTNGAVHVLNVAKECWKWSDAAVGGLDTVVGSTGPARLIGEGSIAAGDPHRLHLHGARPSIIVTLIVGVTTLNAPFKGGVLVPNPLLFSYVPTNAAGNFHITTTFPGGVPAGVPLWHHFWWPDPVGPAGLASSNAIVGITP